MVGTELANHRSGCGNRPGRNTHRFCCHAPADLWPTLRLRGRPPSSTAQPSGEHFVAWLKQGIATAAHHQRCKALVHSVPTPPTWSALAYFQRYAQEHPQLGAGQTGEPAGLAVGAEAFRAVAIASQTAEWSEHLDHEVIGPQKITEATRLPASSATICAQMPKTTPTWPCFLT